MTKSSTSYAHRGDRERARRRRRRLWLAAGLTATGALVLRDPAPSVASAASSAERRRAPVASLVGARNVRAARGVAATRVAALEPHEDIAPSSGRQWLGHWNRVYRLAERYGVAPDLASTIHDVAIAEGIEPELAFRLVRAESEFNERATSPVGAVGLTQVMPGTARYYVRSASRERLYDRHLNLHVGFRYLRGLIHEYKSLRLALLVYNRGPVAVEAALARGDDPANGYQDKVAKGYRGRGTVGFAPRVSRAGTGDISVRSVAASR